QPRPAPLWSTEIPAIAAENLTLQPYPSRQGSAPRRSTGIARDR
ncbi:hypothetical protein A2U01_0118672, partial [Trifolium medium]|nr:hypothetical protein [Trifolium medium]